MAMHDAADEIERLRERLRLQEMGARSLVDILENEIKQLRAEVKQYQEVIVKQAHNRDAGYTKRDAEIERLRELTSLREKQLDTHIHALFTKEAEIERLRAAHDHQYAVAGTLLREAETAQRENERLRELVGAAANEQVEYLDRNNALEARIERLRGELAAEKGWVQQYRDSYGKYAANIAKQQDEIERLRGLLREAADAERDHYATQVSVLMKSGWYKRIRETLGDE
jgi:chromosome segregation ATPase